MAALNFEKMSIGELKKYHQEFTEQYGHLITLDKALENDIIEFSNNLSDLKVSLNNHQMAIKIDMNSLYGILGNRWSRWCNYDIAAAITSSSAALIKFVGDYVNDQYKKLGFNDILIYIDTDSIYLCLEQIVELEFRDIPENYEPVRKYLNDYFNTHIQPLINEAITLKLNEMNVGDIHAEHEHMKMSREVIGSSGFWKTKKKYAIDVYDNEGLVYDEPKLKIMGLETIRRTSPKFLKENFNKALKMILRGKETELNKFNKEMREKFYNSPLNDISPVKPANGLKKYWVPSGGTVEKGYYCPDKIVEFRTGTPSHVRAVLRYNQLLESLDLEDKYTPIKEGDKVHVIYLKEPNHIGLKYIAFPLNGDIPPEFRLHDCIDYKTQFDKVYVTKVKEMTDILNWAYSDQKTLDHYFTKKELVEEVSIKKRRRRVPKINRAVKATLNGDNNGGN